MSKPNYSTDLAISAYPSPSGTVGRLNMGDIRRLANLVAPSRASNLTTKAVEILNKEHLPRTPLLRQSAAKRLHARETFLATASETALLDAYVSLLLGRGDPHDDARFSLDAHERADILASIAEEFTNRDTGAVPEDEVLRLLAQYFEAVDWNEDPVDVLNNLRTRHLLTLRSGQVTFTQASYLHLFAVKRAVVSQDFRRRIFDQPLYYAPIMRHYAALTRDDPEALHTVESLLFAAGSG